VTSISTIMENFAVYTGEAAVVAGTGLATGISVGGAMGVSALPTGPISATTAGAIGYYVGAVAGYNIMSNFLMMW
jgi:hypothetical protein